MDIPAAIFWNIGTGTHWHWHWNIYWRWHCNIGAGTGIFAQGFTNVGLGIGPGTGILTPALCAPMRASEADRILHGRRKGCMYVCIRADNLGIIARRFMPLLPSPVVPLAVIKAGSPSTEMIRKK